MREASEHGVQATCIAWLKFWGAFPIRLNSGAMKAGERYVKFNSEPGCSDVLCVLPGTGRFLALEMKRPGRDRTAAKRKLEQASFRAAVERAGGLALVATSLDELQKGLREAGYDTETRA